MLTQNLKIQQKTEMEKFGVAENFEKVWNHRKFLHQVNKID